MFVVVERRYAVRHHYCVRGNHEFTDQEYERVFMVEDNQVNVMKFCDECGGGK